jgi:hypothetical protein
MSDDNFRVRNAFIEGLKKAPRGSRWDRPLDTPKAQYVPPRVVDVSQKLKEAGVNITAEQLQKALAIIRPPPKRTVNYADTKALANVISRYGVRHIPELNSIPTAKLWLDNKISLAEKIKDDNARAREVAKWQRYTADYQDFDDNPATVDNVVVYDSANPGNVYSVDGYRLASRDKSLAQRGHYTAFPDKAQRKANKLTPQENKYLKRYPTEEARIKHPFDDKFIAWYNYKVPLHRLVSSYVDGLVRRIGFTQRENPNDITSNTKIENTRYRTVMSRLYSWATNKVLKTLYKNEASEYKGIPEIVTLSQIHSSFEK